MRERTYSITWSRPHDDRDIPEQQFCSGLTPRTALARMMAALAEAGAITVHKVERDGRQPRDYMGIAACFMAIMALGYVLTYVALVIIGD